MLSLFQAFGIELEYMVVDRDTKKILPIAESVLLDQAGQTTQEISIGDIDISNELATHVLEFKTSKPSSDLAKFLRDLRFAIHEMNDRLAAHNAMLAPGGVHPTMDPKNEGKVWSKGDRAIYAAYDRIFNCHGHGWFNLQSCHLNLPFANEEEFGRLHAAVILVLPFLSALSASSPYLESKKSEYLDTRLCVYAENQKKIPQIIGSIVPEPVFTFDDYKNKILRPTYKAISPLDSKGLLQHEWLNSRGAIARFDRNAIEIRVLDTQENPAHDVAICSLVIATLETLCAFDRNDIINAASFYTPEQRKAQFMAVAKDGYEATLELRDLPSLFALSKDAESVGELWFHILDMLRGSPRLAGHIETLEFILQEGNLAERMISRNGAEPTDTQLSDTVGSLADCLQNGSQFESNPSNA